MCIQVHDNKKVHTFDGPELLSSLLFREHLIYRSLKQERSS